MNLRKRHVEAVMRRELKMTSHDKLRAAPQLQDKYLAAMREHRKAQRLDVACVALGVLIYLSIFIAPLAVMYLKEMLPWQ